MDLAHSLFESFCNSPNPKEIIQKAFEISEHFSRIIDKEPNNEIGEELLYLLGGKQENLEWIILLIILDSNSENLDNYLNLINRNLHKIDKKQGNWVVSILEEIKPNISKKFDESLNKTIALTNNTLNEKSSYKNEIEKDKIELSEPDTVKKRNFWERLLQVDISPKIKRKKKTDNILEFTITDLCKPLFPIRRRSDVIKEDSPLYPLFKMKMEHSSNSPVFLTEAKKFTRNHPKIDFPYYWVAANFIISGQYNQAEEILIKGIQTANDKRLLATLMATLKLRQSDPIAIGWSMQACLLATNDFQPYKLCSGVALYLGLNSLSWRLRNAGDIISTKSSPNEELEMSALVDKTDESKLIQAFENFENEMDKFLPQESDIPKESSHRWVFFSREREYVDKARNKLLHHRKF